MMPSRATRLTCLACFAVARVATAQQTVDPVTTTSVSGYQSTDVTWLAVGVGQDGLYAITWSEEGDKPCRMYMLARSLSNGLEANNATIDICGSPPLTPSFWPAGSTRTVSFSLDVRHFIRGIAACNNNNNNHRIKGIRIYAAKVWVTKEQVDELTDKDEEEHTNCATWHPAVYCPSDNVASAIVVHHSSKEITGLALRCRKVKY